MTFKKTTKVDKEGTRSERWRSKSVDNVGILGSEPESRKNRSATTSDSASRDPYHKVWLEVDKIKAINPVVACVLPSIAMDFVASSLLAVGAVPLITEDPDDIPKDLANCKAAILDVSAPQVIVESFLEHFNTVSPDVPLVLVASNCGVNDRKKELVLKVLEELVPTVISGRFGDIFAVAQRLIEKNTSPLDSLSDVSTSDDEISAPVTVVVNDDADKTDNSAPANRRPEISSSMSPVLKRLFKHKSASPPRQIHNGNPKSPVSPTASPRTSPRSTASPCTSPRSSPAPTRGIKKFLMKRKRAKGGGLERVPTGKLPRVTMKGQFRETQMSEVTVEMALEYAQKLCVYSGSYVHLFEANVVTSGELVVEIFNSHLGTENLHSTLPCSAAIMAAVLPCVNLERESMDHLCVVHCSHALCLYHVAAEVAGAIASQSEKGVISPGTLRQQFIDALHYLCESEVRTKAMLKIHSQGLCQK